MNARAEEVGQSKTSVALFAIGAFAVTWTVSAWRASPAGSWSGDYASVRSLAASAIGTEGLISAALAGLFEAIPIGTRVQRLSSVSAFGTACSALFAFHLARHALERVTTRAWLGRCLALGASLLIHLSIGGQRAATRPGSAMLANALTLVAIWLAVLLVERVTLSVDRERERQLAAALGMTLAITALENVAAGILGILIGASLWAVYGRGLARSSWVALSCGFVAPLLFIGLPWYVARRGLDGASIEAPIWASIAAVPWSSGWAARVYRWSVVQGLPWLVLALGAMLLAQLGKAGRRSAWMPITLVWASLFIPAESTTSSHSDLAGTVGATALFAAAGLGLAQTIRWVGRRRASSEAPAWALALIVEAVAILAKSEEAAFATDPYAALGADAWVDEAIAILPARSIVLARTDRVVRRILAARYADGIRPDILVVPIERATEPRVVDALLSVEPHVAGMLRDFAINGRPSENALSGLADVRPLYVEFDGSWEPRLREHLLPMPYFHRVLSQTLGRSDRAAVLANGQRSVSRLLAVTRDEAGSNPISQDQVTRGIVELRLREQMTLLLALGDRQAFDTLASAYDAEFKGSEWLVRLRNRLGPATRGAVDAFDLLGIGTSVVPNTVSKRGTSEPS